MQDNMIERALWGLMNAVADVDKDELQRVFEREVHCTNVAAVTTTTAIAERQVYEFKQPGYVLDAYLLPGDTLTSDNTSYATIVCAKRTSGTPGTNVDFLTATTKTSASGGTGNIAPFTKLDLTRFFAADATKRVFAAGDTITFKVTKTAGGVSYPAGDVVLVIKEESA